MSEVLRDQIIASAIVGYFERKRIAGKLTETLQQLCQRTAGRVTPATQSLDKSHSEVGAATDMVTQDGLDNLQIVKQAEADFLRQDLS